MSSEKVETLAHELLNRTAGADAFNVRDLARNLDADVMDCAVSAVHDRLDDWLADNRDLFAEMDQLKIHDLAEDVVRKALRTRWDHGKLEDVIQRHVELIDLSR